MAVFAEVPDHRVASAMAAPTGGCCHDLMDDTVCKRYLASTSGSTRASSPGGNSSTSEATSWGPLSPSAKSPPSDDVFSTLAERRGMRTSILNDLGLELDAGAVSGTPVCSATPPVPTTQVVRPMPALSGTRPALEPRTPAKDASQRSPPMPRGFLLPPATPTRSSACNGSTPTTNSRILRGCLGSSPGGKGDASQRSPASNCQASPAGTTSWSSAVGCAVATRDAAIATARACGTPSGAIPQPLRVPCAVPATSMNGVAVASLTPVAPRTPNEGRLLGTAGNCPVSNPCDASCRNGNARVATCVAAVGASTTPAAVQVHSPSAGSGAALNQVLFASSGLAALSNEDIAARLRAAAPEEYED